jgi:hypothetical protein
MSNGLQWICGRRWRTRLRFSTNMVYVGIYVKRIGVDFASAAAFMVLETAIAEEMPAHRPK